MTFRTKLILAFTPIALLPVAILAFVVRSVMNERLVTQFDERVNAEVTRLERDIDAFSEDLDGRIAAIGLAIADDNRFRLALADGVDRTYLLDYAARASQLGGLDVLQIQDSSGRILSSGHFRNEFDQVRPIATGPVVQGRRSSVTRVQTPTGEMTALVRADSFRLGDSWFRLLGGVKADRFVGVRSTNDDVQISLLVGDVPGRSETQDAVTAEIGLPLIDAATVDSSGAVITIAHSLVALRNLQERLDRWFVVVFGITAVVAVVIAVVFAAQLSKPLANLADQTAQLDLDSLDVQFQTNRRDEIGTLTRLLGAMVARIRTSTSRLREAERRAAVGDLARQINHDIKNGLVPIRNVFDHLSQVQRDDPEHLNTVFGERQETVTSSIVYLENLASHYAKLSPSNRVSTCDVGDIVREAVRSVEAPDGCHVHVDVASGLPLVRADRLAIRRIVENLIGNAVDSLDATGGVVTLKCMTTDGAMGAVRLAVADTGSGMKKEDLDRAFEDFYTTKPSGTGLGLSVVRRLLGDMGGAIRVETELGVGTTVFVDFPRYDHEEHT